MTVVVIPAMIGLRTPVSLPAQASQTDLQQHSRHLKIYGIIRLPITPRDSRLSRVPYRNHATWYSNDALPDGATNIVKVNAIKYCTDLCILDTGANRIVFNNES